MKAAVFKGPGSIVVEDRPVPDFVEPTDAIVRVVLACVCGSDLWFYRGIPDLSHRAVGHEFIGVPLKGQRRDRRGRPTVTQRSRRAS